MSARIIGRISLYRRVLADATAKGTASLYSHELASLAGTTAAQVRRDLMVVGGYTGTPAHGYKVADLMDSISSLLDASGMHGLALVGVGHLGRAILTYFAGRHPNLSFVAAFDTDPAKVGLVISGCRCHAMSDLATVVQNEGIRTAVIAVPAEQAQDVADQLVAAGILSILNFAPASLRVSQAVYVEHNDLTTSIERAAFFARARAKSKELVQ
jgi:redox-sensing transcriptional repressor